MQHCQQSVCNDLAFGSMLLKPSDFDLENLSALSCALWIAAPILKVLPCSQIPGLELLNYLPHQYKAVFIYGGYWRADYIYPEKAGRMCCMAAAVIRKCFRCPCSAIFMSMIMCFKTDTK